MDWLIWLAEKVGTAIADAFASEGAAVAAEGAGEALATKAAGAGGEVLATKAAGAGADTVVKGGVEGAGHGIFEKALASGTGVTGGPKGGQPAAAGAPPENLRSNASVGQERSKLGQSVASGIRAPLEVNPKKKLAMSLQSFGAGSGTPDPTTSLGPASGPVGSGRSVTRGGFRGVRPESVATAEGPGLGNLSGPPADLSAFRGDLGARDPLAGDPSEVPSLGDPPALSRTEKMVGRYAPFGGAYLEAARGYQQGGFAGAFREGAPAFAEEAFSRARSTPPVQAPRLSVDDGRDAESENSRRAARIRELLYR